MNNDIGDIIAFTKENTIKFSLFDFYEGLHKKYTMSVHKNRREGRSCSKAEPIKFWNGSEGVIDFWSRSTFYFYFFV